MIGQRVTRHAIGVSFHPSSLSGLLTRGSMTKTSFKKATKIKNSWNSIIEWNNLKIATVQWHYKKEWKLVDTMDFNLIKNREDKSHIIVEVHTQEDLWQYIKDNGLNIA